MPVARLTLAVSLLFWSLICCAQCGATESELSALRNILRTDPIDTAQIAIGQGRTELFGVAGYSIVVPGGDTPDCFIDRALVRVLPGTTDVVCGAEHQQLLQRAAEYAAKYNAIVKSALLERRTLRCVK